MLPSWEPTNHSFLLPVAPFRAVPGGPWTEPQCWGGIPHYLPPATFHLSPSPLQDLIPEIFSWYLPGKLASITVHFPAGHKPGTLFKLLGSQAGGLMFPCLLELWISALRLWQQSPRYRGSPHSFFCSLLHTQASLFKPRFLHAKFSK